MFQGGRAGWQLTIVLAAYICLDFSSPFVAGAFQFDADQSVDGIVMKASGVHRDGLPVMVPLPDAVRGVEVRNTGREDLFVIKFFGPDVNADVPMIERR